MATTLLRSLLFTISGALVFSACGTNTPAIEGAGGATSGSGGTSTASAGGSGGTRDGTGGQAGSGGTNSGGASPTGGSVSSGGTSGGGGAVTSGGTTGKGGTSGTGGSSAVGGASGKGGTTGSGGGSGGATGRDAGATGGAGARATGGTGAGGAGTGGAAGAQGTGGASGGSTGGGGDLPLVHPTENTGADCAVPTSFPAFSALKVITNFPDPFLMDSGTRIATRDEWRCRRAEISAQIQHWELGTKPAPPSPSDVTATYSGNKLTVVVKVGSKSVTLSTTITLPSTGTAPYPALISMDGSGVPSNLFSSRGVATMSFTSSTMAAMMPTRGTGTFWDLFPDKTAGAYAGWAWGVSRLIDGLEKTADQNKIDTKRLAVTGCSYAGKMALWAGAFDERIALTMPEESGGGGEASWRVMAGQPDTEHLEAAQGTGWYSSNLLQFKNADAPKLPFDQHSLVAMIAPRAVLTIANTSIARLGSEAGYASVKAATEVYKALGVPDRIGYSQYNTGTHCAFPSAQNADVQAFIDKFLLGKTAANVTRTPYTTDMTKWINWSTPTLK